MRLSPLRRLLLASLLPLACKPGDAGTGSSDASGDSDIGTTATGSTTATDSTTTSPTTTDATLTGTTTTSISTSTSTGTSDTTTGGPVACDPDDLPPEGSPCPRDGDFCSPGCSDPCQFCNVLECSRGTWQNAEVFPAQCPSCDEICPAVLAADCLAGPADLDTCLTGCGQSEAGDCMLPYHQAIACGGPAPAFMCDGDGHPVVAGCETQWQAFYACFLP